MKQWKISQKIHAFVSEIQMGMMDTTTSTFKTVLGKLLNYKQNQTMHKAKLFQLWALE